MKKVDIIIIPSILMLCACGCKDKPVYAEKELVHEQDVNVIYWYEPNEPEYLTYHTPKPQKGNILDFIPTWPDCIELEKDLVIIAPPSKIEGLKYDYQPQIRLGKGTKIYYK